MYGINALQSLMSWSAAVPQGTSPLVDGTQFRAAQEAAQAQEVTPEEREAAYIDHLREKYGPTFRIESIPRDPDVLERLGKMMSGSDVIIAPNIVSEMAQDPQTAYYYERTIDHCFETVPQDKAYFAARGLTFEPCGVVVHEDGTVTYICGGGDTPEKVAKINALNAARDARRTEQRRMYIRSSMEAADARRRMFAELAEAQSARLAATVSSGRQSVLSASTAFGNIVTASETSAFPE